MTQTKKRQRLEKINSLTEYARYRLACGRHHPPGHVQVAVAVTGVRKTQPDGTIIVFAVPLTVYTDLPIADEKDFRRMVEAQAIRQLDDLWFKHTSTLPGGGVGVGLFCEWDLSVRASSTVTVNLELRDV